MTFMFGSAATQPATQFGSQPTAFGSPFGSASATNTQQQPSLFGAQPQPLQQSTGFASFAQPQGQQQLQQPQGSNIQTLQSVIEVRILLVFVMNPHCNWL